MKRKLFKLLVDAVDNEGPFFQNYYTYGENFEEAIDITLSYLEKLEYKHIKFIEYDNIKIDEIPDNVIQVDDYEGYIQQVKYGYPISDFQE